MFEKITQAVERSYLIARKVGFKAIRPGYFSSSDPKKKVLTFQNVLKHTKHRFKKSGKYLWNLESEYEHQTRITKVFLVTNFDGSRPSAVYHHGAGEKYNWVMIKGLKWVFDKYNLFLIQAAHHESKKDYVSNCMQSFTDWTSTFTGSVLALESLIQWHKKQSKKPFLVSGGMLGKYFWAKNTRCQ